MVAKKTTTSVSIYIREQNVDKWKEISEKSSFVSTIINNYLEGKYGKDSEYIQPHLQEDIEKLYNSDPFRELMVNKLITEYYKENILFIDDYKKALWFNKNFAMPDTEVYSKSTNDYVPISSQHTQDNEIKKNELPSDSNVEGNSIEENQSSLVQPIVNNQVMDNEISSGKNVEDNKIEEIKPSLEQSIEDNQIRKDELALDSSAEGNKIEKIEPSLEQHIEDNQPKEEELSSDKDITDKDDTQNKENTNKNPNIIKNRDKSLFKKKR